MQIQAGCLCVPLYITVYWCSFWLFNFSLSCARLCSGLFLSTLPLSNSLLSDSLPLFLCLPGTQSKVALELCVWSLVDLICLQDRLQCETIVYPSFLFLFHFFFLNPGPSSREKWLPSLFCFFFLESRKWHKNMRKMLRQLFLFFSGNDWYFGRLYCHVSFVVTDCYMCTSLYGQRLKCQCSHNGQKGSLNPDRWLHFGSVQLQSQMDLLLLLPSAITLKKKEKHSFCKRAACVKMPLRLRQNIFKSMSAPNISNSKPAIGLKKQSAWSNQILHFLHLI